MFRYAEARYYIEMLLKCDRQYYSAIVANWLASEATKLREALELQRKANEVLGEEHKLLRLDYKLLQEEHELMKQKLTSEIKALKERMSEFE